MFARWLVRCSGPSPHISWHRITPSGTLKSPCIGQWKAVASPVRGSSCAEAWQIWHTTVMKGSFGLQPSPDILPLGDGWLGHIGIHGCPGGWPWSPGLVAPAATEHDRWSTFGHPDQTN
jgi:hypothetical protein